MIRLVRPFLWYLEYQTTGGRSARRPFRPAGLRLPPATLTAVDHHGHEALVALDAETGEALGVARMIRERLRPDTAEASVAVVDAWQGRGLGGLLLKRLVLPRT